MQDIRSESYQVHKYHYVGINTATSSLFGLKQSRSPCIVQSSKNPNERSFLQLCSVTEAGNNLLLMCQTAEGERALYVSRAATLQLD